MAVSTGTDGTWKSAEGTLAEVRGQLKSDEVKPKDLIGFVQDGADNFVALYYIQN